MRETTLLQRVLKLFVISALTILFLACPAEPEDEIQIEEQHNKATVFFSVTNSSERTVLPQVSLEDVAFYELLGGKSGEAETVLVESFTETGTSVSLDPGTWNFTLNAYNSSDEHILQGKVHDKQIDLTETNQVSFSLSVVKSGTGSIQITLNFPETAEISKISVNGDVTSENFTSISNESFIYAKNGVTVGDYFINFELYHGNMLQNVVSELVVVRKNLTSSKTITLVGEDLKPVLTGSVSITGIVVVGETLAADTGALNGTGAITYQWKRGTTNIGTNTNTYIVQTADVGETITVTVTRDGYVGDVTSSPTAAVPAPTYVTLSNVTADGSSTQTTTVLTLNFSQAIANLTAYDITLTHSVSGQSFVKGVPTASGSSYTLPISGFTSGGTLSVAVAKPGYSVSGSPKTEIPIYCFSPPLTGNVGIDGTLKTGQTLTANTTYLGGNGTITYEWRRGTTVVGTNSSTYTVVAADVSSTNFTLRVTRAGYSGHIDSLSMLTGSVSITGTVQVGQTLTASTSLGGSSGDIFYQWKRGGTAISGAVSSTYALVAADADYTITVTVTRFGYSGYVTSSATATITLPVVPGSISITGTAQVGQTLTADTTSLGGGSGTISYQWKRGGTAISGATSSTYTLVAADVGYTITVTVTRPGYSGITSSQTATVTLPPLTGSVSITGTVQVGQTLTANTTSLGGSGGTISYQWNRSGSTTSIGTNSTYTVQKADEGSTISVTVTRSGYSGSVTSASTVTVPTTWNWNTSTPPVNVVNGDNVLIASGASGTLVIPENATITISSSGTDWVDNGSRAITLNISTNAKVIWNAKYESSASTVLTLTATSTGTLDVASGNIHAYSNGKAISTTSSTTIIVSGGTVSGWPNYDAVISSTSASGTVTVSGGFVIARGNYSGRQAINVAGTLNITGGLVIAELANATGSSGNGVVSKTPNSITNGTIIGYTLGAYTSGSTTGLSFLPTTGANVSWGLRDAWETGINYRGNFFPVSGVSVGNRIVWNSDRVPSSSSIASGSTITIAAGASGTLTIPANATVTMVSQGTDVVDNGSRQIGLSIGSGAKITWNANYSSSINNTAVLVSDTGTLDVASGSIRNNPEYNGNSTIGSGYNSTIIVSGGAVHGWPAISTSGTSSKVTVSGGTVSTTNGTAISSTGTSSIVAISGGIVSATTGTAINANANGILNITGGLVIAQKSAVFTDNGVSGVISRNNYNALSGNGTIVGYTAGSYNTGSKTGIVCEPSGAAVTWGISNGQSALNAPGGVVFTPVPGVAVGGSGAIFSEDFEGTNSFTIVNGSQTNKWYVGTATKYGGSKSAYISNNSGTSNAYTNNSASVVHMYRDVTFPSSASPYTLSFYWKLQGESATNDYDYLRVFLIETSVSPTAGSQLSSTSLGTYRASNNVWQSDSISIPATNSGTTKRLVFTWVNDGSEGTSPPVAVDNIVLTK